MHAHQLVTVLPRRSNAAIQWMQNTCPGLLQLNLMGWLVVQGRHCLGAGQAAGSQAGSGAVHRASSRCAAVNRASRQPLSAWACTGKSLAAHSSSQQPLAYARPRADSSRISWKHAINVCPYELKQWCQCAETRTPWLWSNPGSTCCASHQPLLLLLPPLQAYSSCRMTRWHWPGCTQCGSWARQQAAAWQHAAGCTSSSNCSYGRKMSR